MITPPAGVDPQIKRMPPGSADPMPVIPPPRSIKRSAAMLGFV